MNSTERFSSRVDNYARYRPGYPREVIETLRTECGLTSAAQIADIGSGTGCLTKLFLQNGNSVFAVEPNREMREAGQKLLGDYPGLRSIEGTAEATTLENQSADFVVSGQAFHWFNREAARREFLRILSQDGWVMIVWNDRELASSTFMIAYDQLLRAYSQEYTQVNHRKAYKEALAEFYGASGFETRVFDYRQRFSLEGIQGRLLSSSYTPEAGHPNHAPMIRALAEIFQEHQRNGLVEFEYQTRMYFGRLR